MSVEKNYKDKVTSDDTQCPSCKNSLEVLAVKTALKLTGINNYRNVSLSN